MDGIFWLMWKSEVGKLLDGQKLQQVLIMK